jgi:ribonuclease HI
VKLQLWVDGAAQGNPGPGGVGVVVRDAAGLLLDEVSLSIGRATNNEAEYRAVIAGLIRARAHGATEVVVHSDSQVVVEQINGRFKINEERLRVFKREIDDLRAGFERVEVKHVYRTANEDANRLAQRARGMKDEARGANLG